MNLFGIKKEESEIDLVTKELKNISFLDKSKIRQRHGRNLHGVLVVLTELARGQPGVNFLIICDEKEKKSRYSDEGKVIINLRFDPTGREFLGEVQKAIAEYKYTEEAVTSYKKGRF